MATRNIFPRFTKTWHHASYAAINPKRAELSAKGKVILVTGGGTGIGSGIVKSFAKAGASGIGIIGRTEASLKASQTVLKAMAPAAKVAYAVADQADADATTSAFKALASELGSIDVFVANAAYLPAPASAVAQDKASVNDFWRAFEVNVKGLHNAARAFMEVSSAEPILLHVSAGFVHLPAVPMLAAYTTSKLANDKFIQFLGAENPQLRTVSVHPGKVETEMARTRGVPGQDDSE